MSNTVDFTAPTARLPSIDDINALGPTEMLYFDEEAGAWWKEPGVCGHMLSKMQQTGRYQSYRVPSVPRPEFLCVANVTADGYNCIVEYWRISTFRSAVLDPPRGFTAEEKNGKLYTIQRFAMDRGELFFDDGPFFLDRIESVTLERHLWRFWNAWNTVISVSGRKFALMTGLPPRSTAVARDLIVDQRRASMKDRGGTQ